MKRATYVLNISFKGKGLKHFERNTKYVDGNGKNLGDCKLSLFCIVAV